MRSIFKNGAREGCFSNRKNTCCSTRHSKPDKPDPHVETSPLRSDRLSWWKAVCFQVVKINTLYCTKAAESNTHAMWAGNPLASRDSRSTEGLLLLCLLATFAYSCVSATAISALPLTVLSADRYWEGGGGSKRGKEQENERERERKRKRQLKKKDKNLKPLVIFSDKSWHPVFVACAPMSFCFRVAKRAERICRLVPSALAEHD